MIILPNTFNTRTFLKGVVNNSEIDGLGPSAWVFFLISKTVLSKTKFRLFSYPFATPPNKILYGILMVSDPLTTALRVVREADGHLCWLTIFYKGFLYESLLNTKPTTHSFCSRLLCYYTPKKPQRNHKNNIFIVLIPSSALLKFIHSNNMDARMDTIQMKIYSRYFLDRITINNWSKH